MGHRDTSHFLQRTKNSIFASFYWTLFFGYFFPILELLIKRSNDNRGKTPRLRTGDIITLREGNLLKSNRVIKEVLFQYLYVLNRLLLIILALDQFLVNLTE